MNDSFEVIAAMFLIREREAQARKDYGAAVAYANAYDLLCYAIHNRHDCLCQFDGYEEANHYLNQLLDGTDIWDLEEIYKG
jgi:hypothetical protein